MTNLTNKVLAILNDIADLETVIYDNSYSANVRIDRKPTPAALLYTLPDWTLDIGHGNSKERSEIQVFFFNRANFDCKAEDKLDIIEDMNLLAREFVYTLLNDNTVRVVDDEVKMTSSFGEFDAFVIGVVVKLTLEERQPSCIYTEPEQTPEPDDHGTDDQNEG